jgi:hypothetical protein
MEYKDVKFLRYEMQIYYIQKLTGILIMSLGIKSQKNPFE